MNEWSGSVPSVPFPLSPPSRIRILLIEDDETILEPLLDTLRFEGFEVASAFDGQQGLQLVGQFQPDVVICDIMMPIMNGHEVLLALRENPGTADIPVVFLTARSERPDVRRGMELGADDYLCKPAAREEVVRVIHAQVRKRFLRGGYRMPELDSISDDILRAFSLHCLSSLATVRAVVESLLVGPRPPADTLRRMAGQLLHGSEEVHGAIRYLISYVDLRCLQAQPHKLVSFLYQPSQDPETLIQRCVLTVGSLHARLFDIKLQIVSLPPLAIANDHLSMLLEVLLDNALRHSAPDTAVQVQAAKDGQEHISLQISDCGPGLSPAAAQFVRSLKENRLPEMNLIGFGLPIMALVAGLYHIDWDIQSEAHSGTSVSLRIPVATGRFP